MEDQDDSPKKQGRSRMFEKPMTPAQLQGRHREKLRKKGHKIIQTTIRDAELVQVLHKYRDSENLGSDTAAANKILGDALSKLKDDFGNTEGDV